MAANGQLYVVATPIGNLQDVSARALEILAQVDVIAAEDTRHSLKLLRHFGIKTPCISLHDHNESRVVPDILAKIARGQRVALISDAGTPLISDPGYVLVREAVQAGMDIISVPGPCALIAALSISGLPADRFVFEGFLPAKSSARLARLDALKNEVRTLIFYESCHRIVETIEAMRQAFGAGRGVVVARELTKMYEQVLRGCLEGIADMARTSEQFTRGEFVILVEGAPIDEEQTWREAVRVLAILQGELGVSQAAKLASEITGVSRKRLYQHALAQSGQGVGED